MALTAVRVKPEQRRFTRNAFITFLQTRHPAVTTYVIKRRGQLVGFVMLIHAENPTQWIIDRLTIDRDLSGAGRVGYAVADQLIDMVHDFENSEMVIARYRPENDAARSLFNKLGFKEREEMFRGRHVSLLEFEFEEDDEDDEDEDVDQTTRKWLTTEDVARQSTMTRGWTEGWRKSRVRQHCCRRRFAAAWNR